LVLVSFHIVAQQHERDDSLAGRAKGLAGRPVQPAGLARPYLKAKTVKNQFSAGNRWGIGPRKTRKGAKGGKSRQFSAISRQPKAGSGQKSPVKAFGSSWKMAVGSWKMEKSAKRRFFGLSDGFGAAQNGFGFPQNHLVHGGIPGR
jgi:hypothetical protein